jgi:hypothetical protein
MKMKSGTQAPAHSSARTQYRLPSEVLKERWRLSQGDGLKRQPYNSRANQGLGLYDRYGRALFYRNSDVRQRTIAAALVAGTWIATIWIWQSK